MATPTQPTDERVGENVRAIREMHGMTQLEVAEKVNERLADSQSRWHQTTLAKVESGARPLKFLEATALAEALMVTPGHFLDNELDATVMVEMRRFEDRVRESRRKLEDAADECIVGRFLMISAVEMHGDDAIPETAAEVRSLYARTDPVELVMRRVADFENGVEEDVVAELAKRLGRGTVDVIKHPDGSQSVSVGEPLDG